jgi:hypothetical protein
MSRTIVPPVARGGASGSASFLSIYEQSPILIEIQLLAPGLVPSIATKTPLRVMQNRRKRDGIA